MPERKNFGGGKLEAGLDHTCVQGTTGGKGIRTPGLLIANETLYQLSYTPVLPMKSDFRQNVGNNLCTPILYTYIVRPWKSHTMGLSCRRSANVFIGIHQTAFIMLALRLTARKSSGR